MRVTHLVLRVRECKQNRRNPRESITSGSSNSKNYQQNLVESDQQLIRREDSETVREDISRSLQTSLDSSQRGSPMHNLYLSPENQGSPQESLNLERMIERKKISGSLNVRASRVVTAKVKWNMKQRTLEIL